jgi:hypothetical protein
MPDVSLINPYARLALLYWRIAIWRRGPQDLPAVGILLPLTIAVYVLLSALLGQLLPPTQPSWQLQLALDVPFMLLWYGLLLAVERRRERYLQTLAALFGLETVLTPPSMVIQCLAKRFAGDPIWQVPVYAAAFVLLLWTLLAVGHILRSTLERALGWSLILAFIQMVAEEMLLLPLSHLGH